MSEKDLKFSKSHEWLRIEGDSATLGLTDYAQGELGDIVFVELPEVGKALSAEDVLTTIESVKSVSEVYAPVDCEVTEVNADLEAEPGLINSDPYGRGWIAKIKIADGADLSGLMTAEEYQAHTKG